MRDNGAQYAKVLDRIIEKYTATPRHDPDLVDYSRRPAKEQSRRKRRSSPKRETRAA